MDLLVVAVAVAGLLVVGRDGSTAREPAGFRLDQGREGPVPTTPDLPPPDDPIPADLQPDPVSTAMDDATWLHHAAFPGLSWGTDSHTTWLPLSVVPMADFQSAGISVHDGLRGTWTPPRCECPTVRLWMYGGSTTYGLNQRDDHTIASELAKLAYADGVRLLVENHGMLGGSHWTEAERFAYELVVDPAPDVALFYDGVNDVWMGNDTASHNGGDLRQATVPLQSGEWYKTDIDDQPDPPAPPGARAVGLDRGIRLDVTGIARLTMDRYDRARQMSRKIAKLHGVHVIYAWQPARISRGLIEGEPHYGASTETSTRVEQELLQRFLADDVIDLIDSLDHSTAPIFTDDVHHNELGSRLIAEALWPKIRAQIRAVAAGDSGS